MENLVNLVRDKLIRILLASRSDNWLIMRYCSLLSIDPNPFNIDHSVYYFKIEVLLREIETNRENLRLIGVDVNFIDIVIQFYADRIAIL